MEQKAWVQQNAFLSKTREPSQNGAILKGGLCVSLGNTLQGNAGKTAADTPEL